MENHLHKEKNSLEKQKKAHIHLSTVKERETINSYD